MTDKPHILFILSDQHRFDCLGAMGHPVLRTPNIDRIAAAGVTFDRAYCPSPVCGPARASLFTGMFPGHHGHTVNWRGHDPAIPLLTDRLRDRGYHTALVGKLHLTPVRNRHGFDWRMICDSPHAIYDPEEVVHNDYMRWFEAASFPDDPAEAERRAGASERCGEADPRFWLGWPWADDAHHLTTWTGAQGAAKIASWDQSKSLFLNVSFFGPHHPYATCEPWDSLYDPAAIELPATFDEPKDTPLFRAGKAKKRAALAQWPAEVWRDMIAKYYGNIAQIDAAIGRMLDALVAAGMWDDTLIVFAADHGDHMGDFGLLGKGDMYDTSARVPLIVKPANNTRAGARCARVVNSLDLFGTFLETAGARGWRDDERIEARSLLPLLAGDEAGWRDQTTSIIGRHAARLQAMLVRDHLKLIGVAAGDDRRDYEMYDLRDAAPDLRDVANDPTCAAARRDMQSALDAWWDEQKANWNDQSARRGA